MKKFKLLLIALVTMVIGFTSTSCTKEDPNSLESVIIGTWRDSAYEGGAYDEYTFRTNGSFTEVWVNSEGYVSTFDGKYALVDDLLTLSFIEDGELYDVEAYEVVIIDNSRLSIGGVMYNRR